MLTQNHIEHNPTIENAIRFIWYRLAMGVWTDLDSAYDEYLDSRGPISRDQFWLCYVAARIVDKDIDADRVV